MYIGNEFEPHQWVANFFRKNAAIKGSKGAELDERLLIVNDLYFPKNKTMHLSNMQSSYLKLIGEDIVLLFFTKVVLKARHSA